VVGYDGKACSGSFKRLYIAGDETVGIAFIAKFLIRPSVQVKICPYQLRAMLEEFLKCVTQSLYPCNKFVIFYNQTTTYGSV